jgi:hypothetical protein
MSKNKMTFIFFIAFEVLTYNFLNIFFRVLHDASSSWLKFGHAFQ